VSTSDQVSLRSFQ